MIAATLKKYADLLREIDARTQKVWDAIPELPCRARCHDCCKQLFPVSFAEAYYLSEGLKKMDRQHRRELAKRAAKIAKKISKENPEQFELRAVDRKTALNQHAFFAKALHQIKSDCPALSPGRPKGACEVYEQRNHDCRSMGSAFDDLANEIIGCPKFDGMKYIAPKLMPFNYMYPQKMKLDQELISKATGGEFTENIFYLTTMCGPLSKDFAKQDWNAFFAEKGVPRSDQQKENEYFVVIDV